MPTALGTADWRSRSDRRVPCDGTRPLGSDYADARQRGWSMAETARASLIAGIGHSTSAIALVVWIAGVAVAISFGQLIDSRHYGKSIRNSRP